MENCIHSSIDYPIRGSFTTKRGTTYKYTIYSDNAAECYRTSTKPAGKPKEYRTTNRFVTPPLALKQKLMEQYGDNLRLD